MGREHNKLLRNAVQRALLKQRGSCHYCMKPLPQVEATADHRIPKSLGGSNRRENIAAACFDCNHTKADVPEGRFFKMIDRKAPPSGSVDLMLIWSSRRIWKRVYTAVDRIKRGVRVTIKPEPTEIAK